MTDVTKVGDCGFSQRSNGEVVLVSEAGADLRRSSSVESALLFALLQEMKQLNATLDKALSPKQPEPEQEPEASVVLDDAESDLVLPKYIRLVGSVEHAEPQKPFYLGGISRDGELFVIRDTKASRELYWVSPLSSGTTRKLEDILMVFDQAKCIIFEPVYYSSRVSACVRLRDGRKAEMVLGADTAVTHETTREVKVHWPHSFIPLN